MRRYPAHVSTHGKRRGTATLEFALCLPVLVIFFFGTIDSCSIVSLQESLEMAAFEGSRVAGVRGTTTADVVSRCNEMISGRGLPPATIETTPHEIATCAPGQLVKVRLTASCDSVGLFFGTFYRGREVESQFTCVRQFNSH